MYNAKNYTELGGEKTVIGGTLELTEDAVFILGGKSVTSIENQDESDATTIADLKKDLNALLEKLKASGLMKEDV